MVDNTHIKQALQAVIKTMMDRVLNKVLLKEPFSPETHRAAKPLYAALVPDEIFKSAHFERRFVTPFGDVWEQLAVVVAQESLGFAKKGHKISGTVPQGRLQRITEILSNLEHHNKGKGEERVRPDWKSELDYVMAASGEPIPVPVVCDVYVEDRKNDLSYAFELKAPMPNSDQTKVSKEKILKLYAMEPRIVTAAYYALPYNPYGTRENYGWSHPARWFNMKKDETVLIGNEFWEKVGGAGTYEALISAVNEIAPEYKARIYRELLGIEPPEDNELQLL